MAFLVFLTGCNQESLINDQSDTKSGKILPVHADIEHWRTKVKPEIINKYERLVYGMMPDPNLLVSTRVRTFSFSCDSIDAILKEIELSFYKSNKTDSASFKVLLITPDGVQSPVFLGINAYGNHTIHSSPLISIEDGWVKEKPEFDLFNHRATASSRGAHASRWPVERLLLRGYGLATFNTAQVFPDHLQGKADSFYRLFDHYQPEKGAEAGAIGLWAWSMSRVLDILEKEEWVDADKIIAIGHSRRGKAALWAAANDQRFAAVISNNSGCGGAALFEGKQGETIKDINDQFPYWFNDNFKDFNNNEDELPIDQHMLLSLMAPRPVYVASAENDDWADPKNEFLSLHRASEVYKLFGFPGIEQDSVPAVNKPLISGAQGYHIRTGGHDLTRYDWERFMDFNDVHVKRNK